MTVPKRIYGNNINKPMAVEINLTLYNMNNWGETKKETIIFNII